MVFRRRQIEGNGFSAWQGEMIPGSSEKSLGNVGLDIPENIFSALILLFIRLFGFLSKLSLGKDGGWCEPIVFIIYCCVTNYPKTQGLKNSYFYLLIIVWVRNSDRDKQSSLSALGSTGWSGAQRHWVSGPAGLEVPKGSRHIPGTSGPPGATWLAWASL